jgi:hypothetical protein
VISGQVTRVDRIDACVEHDAPTAPPRQTSLGMARRVSISVHDPPQRVAVGLRAPPFSSL